MGSKGAVRRESIQIVRALVLLQFLGALPVTPLPVTPLWWLLPAGSVVPRVDLDRGRGAGTCTYGESCASLSVAVAALAFRLRRARAISDAWYVWARGAG